jgi:tRNA A58 N-methylase Trm61
MPVVLELGAGNGVLSHHLRQALGAGARVVACDDNTNKITPVGDVIALDATSALER